jgi:hypothetical protein
MRKDLVPAATDQKALAANWDRQSHHEWARDPIRSYWR